jgi:hypothetical protein
MSHTAALATDDAVPDASLRQAGVARVRTGPQVLNAVRALSGHLPPRGRRVAVVTNSGAAADHLGYPVVLKVAHPSMKHKSEWARPSDPGCPGGDPARDVQLAVARVDEAEATALLRSLRDAAVFDGAAWQPSCGRRGRRGPDRRGRRPDGR